MFTFKEEILNSAHGLQYSQSRRVRRPRVAMAWDWHSETSSVMNNRCTINKLNLIINEVPQHPYSFSSLTFSYCYYRLRQHGQNYADIQTLYPSMTMHKVKCWNGKGPFPCCHKVGSTIWLYIVALRFPLTASRIWKTAPKLKYTYYLDWPHTSVAMECKMHLITWY